MTRALVAEDDVAVREFVCRALAHMGLAIDPVRDGLEALAALSAHRYDLLVSDIVMPRMDGITLALKVAKDWPDIPMILMTGYAHERRRALNLDTLGAEVLTKPFTLDQITGAVGRVLAAKPGIRS